MSSLTNLDVLLQELKPDFTHLHVHSEFSNLKILDSTNRIEDMIKHVNSLGNRGLALTDHETLSGHIQFLRTVENLKKSGVIPDDFKPILGNEIYLVDKEQLDLANREDGIKFYHFLLLAKDKIGHKQIRELSTKAWTRAFTYKGMMRTPTFYEDIEEVTSGNSGHLIASTACLGSFFAHNITKLLSLEDENEIAETKKNIHEFVQWGKKIFGKEDFYIELQPGDTVDQIEYNKKAISIAKAYKLKTIITTDAHYLTVEDREVHKAFLTSDEDDDTTSNREVDLFYGSTHFFGIEGLYNAVKDYMSIEDFTQSVKNTREISEKIEIYSLNHKQVIPKIILPSEDTWYENKVLKRLAKKYEWFYKLLTSSEIYDRYLASLILKGVDKWIEPEKYQVTFDRFDIECKEILLTSIAKEEPISSYFVTMVKNIDLIWEEAQSIVGPWRGSAGAFIIDFLIGISQGNPLNQGIEMPHWRFISAERPDYPDIDIDVPSHKRDIVFNVLRNYYESIGGGVVRVSTFGTETAKSAIMTASRGLKINNDVALLLSSLIPVERGKVWELEDCYYGNEKKGRPAVAEFRNIVDEYTYCDLLKVALGIQGIINKRSTHPCGVLVLNDDITTFNAVMRAPSGELITQFDLGDSEYVGNIKYDLLNTKTCSMIQVNLEMLLEHKKIEWQGSLRETYNKYLYPDVLDRETPEMWEKLHNGILISAFQFDSPVGEQALKAIKPMNLVEITNANNLMRLMVEDGSEQPLDRYVRYKNNIQEWFSDMRAYGLSEDDINIMEEQLVQDYGVCSTQERMMMISMDKKIAGFNVVESNKLRKGVAKKIGKDFDLAGELLQVKGKELGTSQKLLNYVWDVQIAMQKGYSFSVIHGVGYSYILIQQLNLIHHFPKIYWNTAVLLVESGALEQEVLEIVDEQDGEDVNEDENEVVSHNAKEKTTNYGTIAKAIGNMQQHGVNIAIPDINEAGLRFLPNEKEDYIMFGMKGIMKVNNVVSRRIVENRPYSSFNDFYERLVLTKEEVMNNSGKTQQRSIVSNGQTIMLIKAGCFDKIENRPREEILSGYLHTTNPDRKNINGKAIEKVIQCGIVPETYKQEVRYYRFRSYLLNNPYKKDETSKTVKWHTLTNSSNNTTEYANEFFNQNFISELTEGKDYNYDEKGNIWIAMGTSRKGSFEALYQDKMRDFSNWLNTEDCLGRYNEITFQEVASKNMSGNISTWEMESMNYYYHAHELAHIDKEAYDVSDFNELPEEPVVVGYTKYKDRSYPKFALTRIVGTVLDRDSIKHIVTVLTPTGVVQVKFYAGQFSYYDKTISIIDQNNGKSKKTVIEDSWFKRGNLLFFTGFRRGGQFKPKRYKNTIYQHSVAKIIEIDSEGHVITQSDRVNTKSESSGGQD